MKKEKQVTINIYYCDNCGDQIGTTWTTIRDNAGNEIHLCHKWLEGVEERCDLDYKTRRARYTESQTAISCAFSISPEVAKIFA